MGYTAKNKIFPLITLFLLLPASVAWCAGSTHEFKIGTIAPQGSVWANRFDEFKQAVQEKSSGRVNFKIYYGGVMGDDRAMARKMRIGQLQGAGMTVTGLSEIVPDFRVLSIPFLFRNYQEVDAAWDALLPFFTQKFADRNLELLAVTEVGFVYTMSTMPIASPADLKNVKCWIPNGDPLSLAFLQQAGVSPVPLSIADVLPSLQTGLVNTVFNGYYGSIVLQWFTQTKHVSDIPFGYAYGALILDRKSFSRLPDDLRDLVRNEAADSFGRDLLHDTRRSNEEALETLQLNGIAIVPTDGAARKAYLSLRDRVVEQNTGTLFSKETYQRLVEALR